MVDPWGGFNEGMNNLNNTLVDVRKQDRQAAIDDLGAQQARQSLAMGGIQLQNAQRQQDDTTSLRAKLAGVQPQTTTTITPAPAPVQTSAEKLGIGATPGAQYLTNPPPVAPLSGSLESEMQANGLAEKPTPDASGFTMPQPEVSPIVQAYADNRVSTTTKDPNYYKVLLQHAQETGNTQLMEQTQKAIMDHATQLSAISGNPADALKMVNETLGTNMQSMRTGKLDFIKDADGNTVSLFMEDKFRALQASGVPDKQALEQATVQMGQDGSSGQQVTKFLAEHPDANFKDVLTFMGNNNISPGGKGVSAILESLRKDVDVKQTEFGTFKNGYLQEHPQANDAEVSKAWDARQIKQAEAKRITVVNNPLPAKINVNQLEPEEQAAISGAISAGKLDPYKVNSRNQKTLAHAIMADPNVDLNALAANLGLARNVKVQDKAGNAAILPEMIKDVQESGKKLNYSNFAPFGELGQLSDKLTNDPDYINYSAKRNDVIMRIGGVMRENGMTDRAQKLEEDSAPRSMSPRAFDAWAAAQMEVLNPIIKKYTSQAQGKGTPMYNGAAPIITKGGFKVTVVQ
jgi:hypothetical protein